MRQLVAAALVGSAFAPIPSAPAAAQAPHSYTYEFELQPGGKHDRVIHGTVQVSGARARIETDEEKPEGERSYFLLADGGQTVYVVHPDKQTYERHDAEAFAHIVGTALRAVGPVMKLSVRDLRVDTARLGAGTTIAGRRTERTQLRQRWTTHMRVLGFVREDLEGSAVSEFWADPAFPLMRNPLFDIVSTSVMALASADPDFVSSGDAARAQLFRGSPLKADIRLRMRGPDADDRDDDTHLRYEVLRLTPTRVDESALVVPRGYRQTSSKREVSF